MLKTEGFILNPFSTPMLTKTDPMQPKSSPNLVPNSTHNINMDAQNTNR